MTGEPLAGDAWPAQLYFAAGLDAEESSLRPVGPVVAFHTSGRAAGFVVGLHLVELPGVACYTPATFQVRAWNSAAGPTYEAAAANWTTPGIVGRSNLVRIEMIADTGMGVPQGLTGLRGFGVHPVPEPSSLALIGLGGAILGLWRSTRARGKIFGRQSGKMSGPGPSHACIQAPATKR